MKTLIFTVLFMLTISVTDYSQSNVSVSQAIEAARNQNAEIKNRSIELERVRQEGEKPNLPKDALNINFSEIKEDFERIQVVNTNSLQANTVKESLDYRVIFKAVSEIKKRALRLKSNLFPVSSKKTSDKERLTKEQNKFSKKELKTLAVELDNTVYSFISNGIFKNIRLVNLTDSQKAENDLRKIINLCSLIETKTKSVSK